MPERDGSGATVVALRDLYDAARKALQSEYATIGDALDQAEVALGIPSRFAPVCTCNLATGFHERGCLG